MGRWVFALLACVSAATLLLGAQQPVPFKTTTDLVTVDVTVVDRAGQLVNGLAQDDFTIVDNGVTREIVAFSNERQPITVALMLDMSGSMRPVELRLRQAAEAFVGSLLPGDRASLSTLSRGPTTLTSNVASLAEILRLGLPMDFGSPIWAGFDRTMRSLEPEPGRRAIVAFTDGKDAGGIVVPPPSVTADHVDMLRMTPLKPPMPPTPKDLSQRAEREGFIVYAIGFQGSDFDGTVKSIANNSGGRALQLKRDDDLGLAFTGIANELHHQYLIGFAPGAADGKVHTVEIKMRQSGLKARARKTYLSDTR